MNKRHSANPTRVSKVGLNGVTHVPKSANPPKDHNTRSASRVSFANKEHVFGGRSTFMLF